MAPAPALPRKDPEVGSANDGRSAPVDEAGRRYTRLLDAQDNRWSTVRDARERDAELSATARDIERVADNISAVVKMYPPYPSGSQERMDLLNQVTGLRKQIEALEVPPNADADTRSALEELDRAIADASDATAADVEPPGTSGFSDEVLTKLLDKMISADAEIARMRTGMWDDVVERVQPYEIRAADRTAEATSQELAGVATPLLSSSLGDRLGMIV